MSRVPERHLARPATGGASPGRAEAKQWFAALSTRLAEAVAAIAATDSLGRSPRAAVAGAAEADWNAWLRLRAGALTPDSGSLNLAILIDATAPMPTPDARALLERTLARLVAGGRLIVVERVVPGPVHNVRGFHDLLSLVTAASGTSVALADVVSLARPHELHRSTVLLDLFRLGQPEEVS